MKRDVVRVELFRIRGYATEIGFAATARPGSLHFAGELSAREVERACVVTARALQTLTVLDGLWGARDVGPAPGLLGAIRRCFMRRPVLAQLQQLREQLDAVRIGHHVRWESP